MLVIIVGGRGEGADAWLCPYRACRYMAKAGRMHIVTNRFLPPQMEAGAGGSLKEELVREIRSGGGDSTPSELSSRI